MAGAIAILLLHGYFEFALGSGWLDAGVADLVSILLQGGIYVVGAIAAYSATTRTTGRTRMAWTLFCAGWTGAVVAIAAILVALVSLPSFPYAGFILFLFVLVNAMGIVGLLFLVPRRVASGSPARLALDALIVAGCLFAITWVAGAGTLFREAQGPFAERLTDISYPFLNAVYLTIVFTAFVRARSEITPSVGLVFTGIVVVSASDLFYTTLVLRGSELAGTVIGASGATASLLLQALGGYLAQPAPERDPSRAAAPSLLSQLFPILPVGIALPVVALAFLLRQFDPVAFWVSATVVALILPRFALTVLENRRLALELESAATVKAEMLRFLSHEIANPLTPLGLQLYALSQQASVDGGSPGKTLEIANRSLERLKVLARDARSFTQIDAGRLTLNQVEQDLRDTVQAAFAASEPTMAARGITFELETTPDPLPVKIDGDRIGQVLDNLLSNAAKFAANGNVRLVVAREGPLGVVRVHDTGPGMTRQQLAALFQPFSRVHGATQPGVGLGLYISRNIVEGHDGSIAATSPGPGKGSTFELRLPIIATQVANEAAETARLVRR